MPKLKVAKVIGGNTDFLTAQAFTFIRGDQICLACIISGSGEDIFTKVRQAGLKLEDDFFEADEAIPERLKNLTESISKELGDIEGLNLLIAFWQENVLHLKSLGFAKAYLLRKDQIIDLTQDSQTDQLISGFIESQDKVLLISERFSEEQEQQQQEQENESNSSSLKWDRELIDKLLKSQTENLEEEVNLFLSQSPKLEPIAVVLIEHFTNESAQIGEPAPISSDFEPEIPPLLNIENKAGLSRRSAVLSPLASKFTGLLTLLPQHKRKLLFPLIGLLIIGLVGFFGFKSFSQNQSKNNSQSQDLKQESEKNQGSSSTAKIQDFQTFLSLDLIKKDFSSKRMSFSLGQILLLDDNNKSLVAIDLDKKTPQILAGSQQLGQAQFASLNGDKAFVYSKDKGVLRIDLENQKTTLIAKPDSEWGEIVDIFAFGGNVYLLDSLKNQIWKYVAIKSGYSDKNEYLKPNQKVDLAGSKRLQIDYSVWDLKKGPEILRFTAGSPDSFSVGGLDRPIGDISSFFVPEDEDNLYLIDPVNSRLVVLKKTGQYQAQYTADKFKSADDFIYDEKNKKIYLLEGNKISTSDLK